MRTVRFIRVVQIILCLLAIIDTVSIWPGLIVSLNYDVVHAMPHQNYTNFDIMIYNLVEVQCLISLVCYVLYLSRQILPFKRNRILIRVYACYSIAVGVSLSIWYLLQSSASVSQLYNYKELFRTFVGVFIFLLVQTLLIHLLELYQSKLIAKDNLDFP